MTTLLDFRRIVQDAIHGANTTGNSIDAREAFTLAKGQILEGLAKPLLKTKDAIKARYDDKIIPGDQVLFETSEVEVSAKMTAPRETFDKEAFIKAIADKFSLSAGELYAVADTCTKKSAAPVSITTVVFQKAGE